MSAVTLDQNPALTHKTPCGLHAVPPGEANSPYTQPRCELPSLAASQIGTLIAFLAAMGIFMMEAWRRAPIDHRQFFYEFCGIFFATTLYFFFAEWTLEEFHIHELRNLQTPSDWSNALSGIGRFLLRPYIYFPLLLIFFAGIFFLTRHSGQNHWAFWILTSTLSLLVMPGVCHLCKTLPQLEFVLRVLVVVTLATSIGLPAAWIPLVHNPIHWGFIVMGTVYLLFLLWDAVILIGTPADQSIDSLFKLFLVDAIAGILVLATIWGHVLHNDIAILTAMLLCVAVTIAVLYTTPQIGAILGRVRHRVELR
jgi:hypothetical protein